MSDEMEKMLEGLRPRGGAAELRGRVLGDVEGELRPVASYRWEKRCGIGLAAALLLGVCLNYWVSARQEENLAKLFGPPPAPRPIVEVAKAVESVTDKETAKAMERQWCQAYWQHHKQVQHK